MTDRIPPALLRQFGPFYHITTQARAAKILVEGLRPECWDEDAYGSCPVREPFVCLAPKVHHHRYVHAIRSANDEEPTVLLEVATDTIADLDVALDCTTTELEHFAFTHGTRDPAVLLGAGVPVMCYSLIPASGITSIQEFVALLPQAPMFGG